MKNDILLKLKFNKMESDFIDNHVGLIFGCPKGHKLDECPFSFLRTFSNIQAVQKWKALSEDEKKKMIHHHFDCSNQ